MATASQPTDVLRRMFDDSMTMLDPWMAAWTNMATPAPAPGKAHRTHGCGHCCGCSSQDADLVLVARPGERRIVPLSLHNEWRRERPVTIAVSAFRSCDPCVPDVPIEVTTQPRGEIVLPPCSRTVVDVVVVLPERKREEATVVEHACCVTLVGDISTDGCARPVRLAVVVLPHDCDAHEIDCCSCCSC